MMNLLFQIYFRLPLDLSEIQKLFSNFYKRLFQGHLTYLGSWKYQQSIQFVLENQKYPTCSYQET